MVGATRRWLAPCAGVRSVDRSDGTGNLSGVRSGDRHVDRHVDRQILTAVGVLGLAAGLALVVLFATPAFAARAAALAAGPAGPAAGPAAAATPSTAALVAAQPPTLDQGQCDHGRQLDAGYVVPATTGVSYLVGGRAIAYGPHPAAPGATVTVSARARPGYVLTGVTSFAVRVPLLHCAGATTVTTAAPPVSSTSPPAGGGSVGARAVRSSAASPTAPNSVVAAPAMFRDPSCRHGQQRGASYSIPTSVGVSYLVNGSVTSPGSYPADAGTTVVVAAHARAGYVLTGISQWRYTFAAAPGCASRSSAPAQSGSSGRRLGPGRRGGHRRGHGGGKGGTGGQAARARRPAYTGMAVAPIALIGSGIVLLGLACVLGAGPAGAHRAKRAP